MRRPGIEPGSTGWKPVVLTIILPAHKKNRKSGILKITVWNIYILDKPSSNSLATLASTSLGILELSGK